YKITFQQLAQSSQTDYWGKIDVHHNGRLINHLNFVTLEVTNQSKRDLESINIDISSDINSQILGHNAFYNSSNHGILLESIYYNYYQNVLLKNVKEEEAKLLDPN